MHGAHLARSLQRTLSPSVQLLLRGVGGPQMAAAGVELYEDTQRISSIGIVEALRFVLPTLLLYERVKQRLLVDPPDAAVLIDYIGPNIALAQWLRARLPGVPVLYYIGPQEWVWNYGGRPVPSSLDYFPQLRACCRCLLAVFPLEAEFYRRRLREAEAEEERRHLSDGRSETDAPQQAMRVEYVGHPIVDMVTPITRDAARAQLGCGSDLQEYIVTLMAASREQELHTILPVMIEAAVLLHQALRDADGRRRVRFLLPVSRPEFRSHVQRLLRRHRMVAAPAKSLSASPTATPDIHFRVLPSEQAMLALAAADVAMCKSGTVNLEAAALGVPQVVLYRVSAASAWLIRRVLQVQLPYVSAVNIVHMRAAVVPELLQEQATPQRLFAAVHALLKNADGQTERMLRAYREQVLPALQTPETRDMPGRSAAERTAHLLWRTLRDARTAAAAISSPAESVR